MKLARFPLIALIMFFPFLFVNSCVTEGPLGGPDLIKQWEMTNFKDAYPEQSEYVKKLAWEFNEFGRLIIYGLYDEGWFREAKYLNVKFEKTDSSSGTIYVDDCELSPMTYHSLTLESVAIRAKGFEIDFLFKSTSGIRPQM